MHDRHHVGALGEFQAENIIFCIRRRQLVNHIAGGQHQAAVFDDAHVIVAKLQRIGLHRRKLERYQATFAIRVFCRGDELRARAVLYPAILPHNKVIALAQRHLVLCHIDAAIERWSNFAT
ncbi:Uncharacterised protein [Klebsiella pneumoniae]|nr:Uncharacterised protein [Klebsiella pneumoniae]